MRPVDMDEIFRVAFDNRTFFCIGQFALFLHRNDPQHVPPSSDFFGYPGFGNAIEYPINILSQGGCG